MNARSVTVLILLAISSFSCSTKQSTISTFNGFAQGTTYSVAFVNPGKFNPLTLRTDVEKILHDFDMSLSLYQDSSILSRVP